jgi:5,10-methylenetetrahydromethanopterin reductase
MNDVPSIGVTFPARDPVESLPDFAARAERAGLDELWVVEDCFLSGGIAMAATALAVTRRLRVGIGLLPVVARNPVIAAMDIGSLARLHPGRFAVAFGHGVSDWMRQIGAYPRSRLAALEEVTTAVRALLHGETVSIDGSHVRLDNVKLEDPPKTPPRILIGTTGPRGLRIAGRSADGILLAEGAGAPFVESAVRCSTEAGGDTLVECVVYVWARIDDDERRANDVLGPAIDHWLGSGRYPEPSRLAPADLSELGAIGRPAACARTISGLAAAGANSIVLTPLGDDVDAQVDRIGAEVLPLVRAQYAAAR